MKELIYVTGNKDKFADGNLQMQKYGFACVQQKVHMQELQHTDGEIIARHKAQQAYDTLKKPVLVNDTTWLIPALNDFPGVFMQYTNDCFNPNDWLRLMDGVEDRRAIIREILVYKNANYEKVFFRDAVGSFLHEASGTDGVSSDKVISFSGNGVSVAAARDSGIIATMAGDDKTGYDLLGEWLQSIESPATRNIA